MDFGFVVQGVFANGDALAGITPKASNHDEPTVFYRFDPVSKRVSQLKGLGEGRNYFAFDRDARHVAVLEEELKGGDYRCQAVLLLDHKGRSDAECLDDRWAPAGKNKIAYGEHRRYAQISVVEGSGISSRIELTGSTDDGYGTKAS